MGEHDGEPHDVAEIHAGDQAPDANFCSSTNNSGPGCRPQISRPPSSTAAVGEPASSAIGSAEVPACAAVSGSPRSRRCSAELVAVLDALGDAVAGVAPAGVEFHPAADDAGAQRLRPAAALDPCRRAGDLGSDAGGLALERQVFLHGEQDLADEQATISSHQEIEADQAWHRRRRWRPDVAVPRPTAARAKPIIIAAKVRRAAPCPCR